jgi:hypothetical protein
LPATPFFGQLACNFSPQLLAEKDLVPANKLHASTPTRISCLIFLPYVAKTL